MGTKKSGTYPKHDIEKFAELLLEWSDKPNSYILLDFINQHNILPQYLSVWCERSSIFDEALKITKSKLAARRQKMVEKGTLNYGVFMRYQGMYDHLLDTFENGKEEFKANLRRKVDEANDKKQINDLRAAIVELSSSNNESIPGTKTS